MNSLLLGYDKLFLQGLSVTLEVALKSLVLSIVIGILLTVMSSHHSKFLNRVASAYKTFVRGVPDLILLFLTYYGGLLCINKVAPLFGHTDYISFNGVTISILVIGMIFGAYMGESFRNSYQLINSEEIEGAVSFAFPKWALFFHIMLPHMLRYSIIPVLSNWLVMTKSIALISLIGVRDLVGMAVIAGNTSQKPFYFLTLVGIVYLGITGISVFLCHILSKKLNTKFGARI